jgi:triacylglycerol lipase
MGGLDARYLISKAGFHKVVASLVTVSSPHRGSGIANLVLEQPQRMQLWTADVLNWMGTASMGEIASDFLGSVPELTPEYVLNEFNAAVPDHPSVRYFSYAGQAGKGTGVPINPLLLVLNLPLYAREGPNDGFVSVESARWGEFLGTIGADHAAQVGIKFLGNRSFDSHEFYRMVVARLAEEGF